MRDPGEGQRIAIAVLPNRYTTIWPAANDVHNGYFCHEDKWDLPLDAHSDLKGLFRLVPEVKVSVNWTGSTIFVKKKIASKKGPQNI